MTPEQLKQKPFKEIINIGHEKLDREEGQSNEDEAESTTPSEILEEDSTSDTPTETTEDSQPTEIPQVHNVLNNIIHMKMILYMKMSHQKKKMRMKFKHMKTMGSKITYIKTTPNYQL